MTLPASGLITAAQINAELNRSASAPINLNDPEVRMLAGKTSGTISFSDFHGKSAEIVKTVTTSRVNLALRDLFSDAEWNSPIAKRVVINSGVYIGDTSQGWALIPFHGDVSHSYYGQLTLENRGEIQGRGGAANSGEGGHAIFMNSVIRDSKKMIINNHGAIRSGGGGGGRGGNGGGGVWYSGRQQTDSEGPLYSVFNPVTYYLSWQQAVIWKGVRITTHPLQSSPVTVDGWTYYIGDYYGNPNDQGPEYSIRRTRTYTVYDVPNNTNGGAGGNGGRGQGYDGGYANGAGGAAGGTNAGAGGTGGRGGGWGASGATGATGANGNRTNGAGGAGGGAAGYYLLNSGYATLNNYGTVQGRI